MFIDEVVVAGLIIISLTLGCFGFFYWLIKNDIKRKGTGE